MDGWVEFALERYNYWIVIILMMTGLYTVFARGNLVKKVVGLNLFQTSVFIFYITIGKISGGTAPIFLGDSYKAHGYGEAKAGKSHGAGDADPAAATDHAAGLAAAEEAGDAGGKINNLPANDLKTALDGLGPAQEASDAPSLHAAPADADKLANEPLTRSLKPSEGFELAPDASPEIVNGANVHGAAADAAGYEAGYGAGYEGAGDALSGAGDVIYTNPLPHVLILTAIVVGVATTAVGLALAVRIREAYGAIEEDELVALDNVAEFGPQLDGGLASPPSGGAA